MTCNHAKINDSDRSDAANVDAADAHKSEKRVHNLTVDATQRNAGTSVILLTDLKTLDKQEGSRHQTHTQYQDMDYRNTSPIMCSRIKPVR